MEAGLFCGYAVNIENSHELPEKYIVSHGAFAHFKSKL